MIMVINRKQTLFNSGQTLLPAPSLARHPPSYNIPPSDRAQTANFLKILRLRLLSSKPQIRSSSYLCNGISK